MSDKANFRVIKGGSSNEKAFENMGVPTKGSIVNNKSEMNIAYTEAFRALNKFIVSPSSESFEKFVEALSRDQDASTPLLMYMVDFVAKICNEQKQALRFWMLKAALQQGKQERINQVAKKTKEQIDRELARFSEIVDKYSNGDASILEIIGFLGGDADVAAFIAADAIKNTFEGNDQKHHH